MPHLNDGMLMSYLDTQLAPDQRQVVEEHLAACPACQERLDGLTVSSASVSRLMVSLNPFPSDHPNARRALSRLQAKIKERQEMTMFEKFKTSKRYQRALAGVVTLLVLIALFSFAPVRAFASDLLSLFRTERFVAVNIDPQRVDEITAALGQGQIFGEQEILQDTGELVEVASLDEAAAMIPFALRTPRGYGDPTQIMITGEGRVRYTPDVEALRQVFMALNLDPTLLPDNIDGQPFDFTLPAGVVVVYDDGDPDTTTDFAVMQMPSPTADIPDGVDMRALGEAMLQVFGMSPQEAQRMSDTIDWTTTLVLPIPTDALSAQEVSVDGTTGLFLQSSDGEGNALLWQRNGIVTMITGNANMSYLLNVAGSLR